MSSIVLQKMKKPSLGDKHDDFVDVMRGMNPGEMPMPDEEGTQQSPSFITWVLRTKWS